MLYQQSIDALDDAQRALLRSRSIWDALRRECDLVRTPCATMSIADC